MELSAQTNRLVVTSGTTVSFIPALLSGPQTHSLTLPYAPSSASIHPILQDRFVTGSTSDEWVRVHDLSGEELEVLKGHHGPVHCVEYSPDGEMFASGSGECNVIDHLIWLLIDRTRTYCNAYRGWLVISDQYELGVCAHALSAGTIRLWQTTPGKSYGLWQGAHANGGP